MTNEPKADASIVRAAMMRSLALLLTVAAGVAIAFLLLLRNEEPGKAWTVLGAGLFALWYLPRVLPGLRERHELNAARDDARRLVKSVRAAMKKQRSWHGDAKEQLESSLAALEKQVEGGSGTAIADATNALDALADKHILRKSAARETVEQIGGAVLAALLIRAFFYEAFRIPSPSMVPTLLVGDHLFVNKFVYGLRVPFTLTKVGAKLPSRGDIVVFNKPGDESGDDIIKRVIGLPGEVVRVRDRHVSICRPGGDCTPLQTSVLGKIELNYQGDSSLETRQGPFETFLQYAETVDTHEHVMQAFYGELADPRTEGDWMVEPGHVFVMGDNRDNSTDSRIGPPRGFGQVPIAHIKGRADIIWLSVGGPYGVRFARFFKLLH